MHPVLIELFGIPFGSWHVFFALAATAAYLAMQFLVRLSRRPDLAAHVPAFFIVCYLGGWFGARALSIAVEQLEVVTLSQFFGELFVLGPMTFYGGAIGAFVVGLVFCLLRKLPVGFIANHAFPAGVLALGIGRIGCFLNGDDYGRPVGRVFEDSWWAIEFPNLMDGVKRYPAQLQEALASFVIVAFAVWALWRKSRKTDSSNESSGLIACGVIMASAVNRFFNEFFRGDPRGGFFATELSTSQGIAIFVFFIALATVGTVLFSVRTRQGVSHS